MSSGKMRPKRDDLERERLAKRTRKTLILAGKKIGKLTDSEKKPPSQRKSESGRKRYARRDARGQTEKPNPDCWLCPRRSDCKVTADDSGCTEHKIKQRCPQCDQLYLHYFSYELAGMKWICPVCRGR